MSEAARMSWFMDQALSRRLERAEGLVGTTFSETNQRIAPERGSVWRDFAGTYAIFDGPDSPMTQTFGLGLFTPVTPDSLAEIEAFFTERGAPVMHEVSPLAGIETFALLAERGYRPNDLSTVLVQPLAETADAPTSGLRVRTIEDADHAAWIETSVLGWSADPTFADIMRSMATVAAANTAMTHFLVERDGAPIATASLGMHEGVALLAGASTIPSGRNLGAQALLLTARLAEARRRGCDLAMMLTTPGSTSQRNAERRGFRVAYTRTKWRAAASQ
jgi:hypothetical protein